MTYLTIAVFLSELIDKFRTDNFQVANRVSSKTETARVNISDEKWFSISVILNNCIDQETGQHPKYNHCGKINQT